MASDITILVIDDEPDNFDVIEALLSNEGYQLIYSSSGKRAIDRLEDFCPDIVLLDGMMPEMDGIEFCQIFKAKQQWQSIPIIMVTALNSREDLARCLAAGADDFISKPVNGVELRARVRSMLRIKQQHDALQAILQLRTDLSNMIVHDLRNPLASIVLATDLLRMPNLSLKFQQEKLNQIAISTQQLQSLIDSLLLLAKMEAGQMTLQRIEVDLCAICSSALSVMEPIATQKDLQLIGHLPEPGGFINVDVALFRRVLDNLLANAIKFSPSNSQIIVTAAYTTPDQITSDQVTSCQAKIQIADSGPGVDQEMQQSIFEKFEIGTPIQGASQIGLGLTFCKLAIEAHGGQIKVEPNHPTGAIFTIEL